MIRARLARAPRPRLTLSTQRLLQILNRESGSPVGQMRSLIDRNVLGWSH
jgi:hypothetical protein